MAKSIDRFLKLMGINQNQQHDVAPRSETNDLPPVEQLEQRLCLGSMHAGVANWANQSQEQLESRTASEIRIESRLANQELELSQIPPLEVGQEPSSGVVDGVSDPDAHQPTEEPETSAGDDKLLKPQITSELQTAIETNLNQVIRELSFGEPEQSNEPVLPKSHGANAPHIVEPQNEPVSQPVESNETASLDASTGNSQSSLTAEDLEALGLELDEDGNAIGFTATEIADRSGMDAWWSSADESVVIFYDFRDIDGHENKISDEQKEVAVEALNAWSEATGRDVVFEQNTEAPENRIINIGVGDLAAVGHVSGEGAVLGLGGGQVTAEGEQLVANGIAWLDEAEKWDNTIGNGDQADTFDFPTVVAHELGHTLGLGDKAPTDASIMNGTYNGERDINAMASAVADGNFNRTVVDAETADAIEMQPMTAPGTQLSRAEVQQLLQRASVISASEDAIIAVVDRNGRILGVRVEQQVLNTITDDATLVFAIDGAVAKARTAALFSNGDPDNGTLAPLTSRTVRFLSQTTITQREVEANPNVDNASLAAALASTTRGPGFVAPIGVGAHFPPEINFTPQVDLFAIEHTNRDSTLHPGVDGIRGTADDIAFTERFNIDPAFVPAGQNLFAPESFGSAANSGRLLHAQSRGIATLPGGIPLFRDTDAMPGGDTLIGGIGVFFPGADGFASHEQGFIPGIGQTEFERTNSSRTLESEIIAFMAAGGSLTAVAEGFAGAKNTAPINGVAPVANLDVPFGRLDLVGIQLDVFGPMGSRLGLEMLLDVGATLGVGNDSGLDQKVTPGVAAPDPLDLYRNGLDAPEGWLVTPHDSADGLVTAADVQQIIQNARTAAENVRAAVRLPISSATRMVFAVTDTTGELLGLFRMQDATTFSIDVAVAKARNVAYYADANDIQTVDRVGDTGVAFTNRTFRFLSQPRFPSGINGTVPAPFSTLHDGNINQANGENLGAPAAVGDFVDNTPDDTPSVLGFNSFFPMTNFRDPGDGLNGRGQDTIANQNGIVFFPGSTPIYKNGQLIGGFGVSGDGVDQDDVVTYVGATGFLPEGEGITRADETFVRDIRLPYQKFLRNPFGGLC